MKKFVAVFMVLMLLCSMSAAFADECELHVNGNGKVYMDADSASITLGITLNGEDVAALQKEANETVEKICAALQEAGIPEKDISTNYLYISPRYDYSGDGEKIIGYSINHSLAIVTEEIDQIGNYIDIAFASGANTFDSIGFSVKDPSGARKQALEIAIADAREKAQVIANASGKTLGEILEISENTSYNYNYDNGFAGVSYADGEAVTVDAGTVVRASQVEINAGIDICYELK